ncbi:hypothetical protein B0H12DRAFT_646452 [Mycena haematopus]|nr:hypothetical protein B0H12DRAFT_646452 [Mycena haematopus]
MYPYQITLFLVGILISGTLSYLLQAYLQRYPSRLHVQKRIQIPSRTGLHYISQTKLPQWPIAKYSLHWQIEFHLHNPHPSLPTTHLSIYLHECAVIPRGVILPVVRSSLKHLLIAVQPVISHSQQY